MRTERKRDRSEGSSCSRTGPCSRAKGNWKETCPQEEEDCFKPEAAKSVIGEDTDESDEYEEQESQDTVEEEPQVS